MSLQREVLWSWVLMVCLAPAVFATEQFTGQVVGVDGDTLAVLRDGHTVQVGLYGIAIPQEGQPYSTPVRQFIKELTLEQSVNVVVHTRDRSGRLIGDVFLLPGKRNLSHVLAEVGFAWWYRQDAPEDTALAQREEQAKAAKRGLWRDTSPVAPWLWRQQQEQAAPVSVTEPAPAQWQGYLRELQQHCAGTQPETRAQCVHGPAGAFEQKPTVSRISLVAEPARAGRTLPEAPR